MLVIAVAPAGATGPVAVDRPADVPHGMEWDPATGALRADVLAIDAERIARSTGEDERAVLAHLNAQALKDSLVETLAARFPDRYGGVYWDDNDNLVLQFKGGAPDAAIDLIASAGLSARSESVRYSEAEAEALSASIAADLESAGAPAVVALDSRSQRILVTLGGKQGVDGALADKESVSARLAKQFSGVDIEVSVADGPIFSPWSSQGGGLASRPNLTHYCTIGFTVYVGSTRGLITAGHCENATMDTYTDPFTGGTATLSYRVEHQSSFGDMQWHTSSTNEVDDFYSNLSGAIRDVTGIAPIALNDTFNYWGWGTQHLWTGTIGWTLVFVTGGPGNLACFLGSSGGPGDSGGPVFTGRSAAGIIMGSVILNGAERACFSKASRFDDGIGVWLATN
jgi:hypothetical protein